MTPAQIEQLNYLYHVMKEIPHTTEADDDLIDYLRAIQVDQPLTSHHTQQLSDIYKKYEIPHI